MLTDIATTLVAPKWPTMKERHAFFPTLWDWGGTQVQGGPASGRSLEGRWRFIEMAVEGFNHMIASLTESSKGFLYPEGPGPGQSVQ